MRGKEEKLLQLSLEDFLLKQSPANDANKTSTERCCIYRVRIENISSYVSINC